MEGLGWSPDPSGPNVTQLPRGDTAPRAAQVCLGGVVRRYLWR